MDCWLEVECKLAHDPMALTAPPKPASEKCIMVPGPLIVGGGPSGLAVAACLKKRGIPSLILERANCVASLWQLRTYDRLHLHLPKQFCELPMMPFPSWFPTYPTKQQFIAYLNAYAKAFDVQTRFNETVVSAEHDAVLGLWRVRSMSSAGGQKGEKREYLCRWVVAATGENADAVVPEIEGMDTFGGSILHTSSYRSGDTFINKKVLVVGCGNSGMEVSLDLCNHNAQPSMVVRDSVHVLPREMLGRSTFGLSMWLMKWLPVRAVDFLLLLVSRFVLGDTSKLRLQRPRLGPLELKEVTGSTPVLDVGTLAKIRSGDIKLRPALKRLNEHGAEFIDGTSEEFDAVILATGYRSNISCWLKEKDGLPGKPFPNGWKGERGLYAAGFTKRGLLGASLDATRIAQDIEQSWKSDTKKVMAFSHPINVIEGCVIARDVTNQVTRTSFDIDS